MTTVPQTEEMISHRIEQSVAAFGDEGTATASQVFFFVLELDGKAAGMASIFPDLGADRPFYSYHLSHFAAQAPESGLRASSDVLSLCNDFHGFTEIGTLLVGEAARGRGAGRLLSLSRLFYLGQYRHRFGESVMAEIRGHFEPDGRCPFWEHVGAKFFHLTFEEADRLSAHDFRFISHLMPKFPIYVSLLPDEARQAIGRPHATSGRAMALLAAEGFRWTRYVDIFDGGPSVECPLAKVRTVATTHERALRVVDNIETSTSPMAFVLSAPADTHRSFTTTLGYGGRVADTVSATPAMAERLGLKNGDVVICSPLKGG